MKTIGLLGGTAWISTIEYYRLLNQKVQSQLGKSHSARIILNSIDYEEIKQYNYQNWAEIERILKNEILRLNACDVDCILICNNTLHKAYDAIADDLRIQTPVFHIAECAGAHAKSKQLKEVLLLGTKFTMEEEFYKKQLESTGLKVVIPERHDRNNIQHIIQEELSKGIFNSNSRKWFQQVISQHSCDGVILACTELPLLIQQKDYDMPILNTVDIHCETAVAFSLSNTTA